jgi:hypothetical protein
MTTITQENLARQCEVYRLPIEQGRSFARALGITITPAEPPAEMVKLAREIVAKICDQQQQVREVMIGDWDTHAVMRAALATLQHAVNVVKGAHGTDVLVERAAILTALVAGGRDAG